MKKVGPRRLELMVQILGAVKLESDCLLGRIDGTRARGNRKMTYMDSTPGYFFQRAYVGGAKTRI